MQTQQHSELERRAAAGLGAEGRRVKGYAIVFNELSEDLGGFREIIEPSAVDRTLAENIDVRALVDHDPAKVIGRKSAETLWLLKDERGLRIEIDVPKTTVGDDILELVGRRDVSNMSFTFSVVRPEGERWERRNGMPVRIVTDARIPEVSIVTFAAYSATDVQVAKRSLQSFSAPAGRSIAWLRMAGRTR